MSGWEEVDRRKQECINWTNYWDKFEWIRTLIQYSYIHINTDNHKRRVYTDLYTHTYPYTCSYQSPLRHGYEVRSTVKKPTFVTFLFWVFWDTKINIPILSLLWHKNILCLLYDYNGHTIMESQSPIKKIWQTS